MYRLSSPLPTRSLTVRPDPVTLTVVIVVIALFCAGGGGALAFVADIQDPGTRWMFAGACWLVALLLGAFGGFMALSSVRFDVSDAFVRIQWMRAGSVRRTEQVSRSDVVDVGLDGSPSSGGIVYRIVVGTKHGDIALSDIRSSADGPYRGLLVKLSSFLGVPIRPS